MGPPDKTPGTLQLLAVYSVVIYAQSVGTREACTSKGYSKLKGQPQLSKS